MLAVVDVKKVEGRIESLWPAEKTVGRNTRAEESGASFNTTAGQEIGHYARYYKPKGKGLVQKCSLIPFSVVRSRKYSLTFIEA